MSDTQNPLENQNAIKLSNRNYTLTWIRAADFYTDGDQFSVEAKFVLTKLAEYEGRATARTLASVCGLTLETIISTLGELIKAGRVVFATGDACYEFVVEPLIWAFFDLGSCTGVEEPRKPSR